MSFWSYKQSYATVLWCHSLFIRIPDFFWKLRKNLRNKIYLFQVQQSYFWPTREYFEKRQYSFGASFIGFKTDQNNTRSLQKVISEIFENVKNVRTNVENLQNLRHKSHLFQLFFRMTKAFDYAVPKLQSLPRMIKSDSFGCQIFESRETVPKSGKTALKLALKAP